MSQEIDEIIQAFKRGNVFLHGPGGTGKSYTISKIMEQFGEGHHISCTASTGIAAVNLSTNDFKATTLHKWTGLQLCQKSVDESVELILKKFPLKRKWQYTKYLIIDEISMISGVFFEKLDAIARRVRGKNLPFGGIHILASGDFLQLPPVEGGWIFENDAWKDMNFKVFHFKTPKRYPDEKWFDFLIRCREGKINSSDLMLLKERNDAYKNYTNGIKTPTLTTEEVSEFTPANSTEECKCAICLNSGDVTVTDTYAKTGCGCFRTKSALMHSECLVGWLLVSSSKICPLCKTEFSKEFNDSVNVSTDENGEFTVKPTILYPTRRDVAELNRYELEKLPTTTFDLVSIDRYHDIKTRSSRIEQQPVFEEAIPEKITLKVGAQVMLKFNIDTDMGLANGTRGVIVDFTTFNNDPLKRKDPTNYQIKVRWYNGLTTIVEPQIWKLEDDFCIRSRTQIPLVLAWALTIHKSQGSTLDYVICDLGSSVFAPGQAYVALSRVKTIEGLLISQIDYSCLFNQDKKALCYINTLE